MNKPSAASMQELLNQGDCYLTDKQLVRNSMEQLRDIGALFYNRGWSLGTSSNYSTVVNKEPLRLLMTASGKDKRSLRDEDLLLVDEHGKSALSNNEVPSAETLLHMAAIENNGAGAVLHTHSVWSTLLSDVHFASGGFNISGYEMLKGLSGIKSHEETVWVPIFDNSQNMAELSGLVKDRMLNQPDSLKWGYLLRNHGLYTWGRDLNEARRHVEIFEFLFEVLGRKLSLTRNVL
jgi:methylthioribulose-1-phosphate dehydratase